LQKVLAGSKNSIMSGLMLLLHFCSWQ